MKNSTQLLIAFLVALVFTSYAQQPAIMHDHSILIAEKLKSVQHDFDADSLRGFHDEAAWQQAKMGGAPEWEQKIQVSHAKRNYINTKYGITSYSQSTPPTVQSPCTNVDFETGNATGWTITEGLNTNSNTQGGCCATASSRFSVVTPGTDPSVAALQRVPVGGGNYALKIGDGSTIGGYAVKAKQTFSVTTANSVFIYKFAVVLEDGSHTCAEQPYFNISFNDASNNPIPCGDFNVIQGGSGCSTGADPSFITSGIYSYKNWTTRAFDLTSYIGQNVTVEFIASDCVQTGHAGWAYVDASCQPFTLNLNGNNIPVGQTNSSACGAATSNTLCAPPGFSYSWTGPGVTGQTGQCINASSAGTYSVSLGITGAVCAFNPILYSNFLYSPNPTVSASLTQPICALPVGSATINVTNSTGPFTYSWTPAAPSASVNTNLPDGTSYTVSVIDQNGCSGATSFSVDPYPPAPAFTLSAVPGLVISCTTPSITMTFAPTNTNTTTQWDGPLGAISGTTTVANTAGAYTYTTINTVSTCSLTGTINITGVIINPVVTTTVTQPNCALPVGSATINATNGTGAYTYTWSPAVPLPFSTENTNLPPGTTYTVSTTDALGCMGSTTFSVNNFSGSPSYTLSNNPGLALSCPTPSTTLYFAPTNANTSTLWQGPSGIISGTTTIANTAGVYSYTATNNTSMCVITGTIGVTSNVNLPVATYSLLCNTNTVNIIGSSTNPDIVLNWTEPNTQTSLGNPATSTATGIFTLTATNPLNGCTQTYTITSVMPTVSILSAPASSLTCVTHTINATAVATPTNALITWYNGTNTSTTNPYVITSNGSYTANVQMPNGCSINSVITVNTNTTANVSITSPSTIIPCSTGLLPLTGNSTGGGVYTYVWNPATPSFTGNPYSVSNGGTYTVFALNTTNGCTATATQAVTQETIDAAFIADPYVGLTPLTVTFTNTSTNATTYYWDLGNGTTQTTTNTATVYNTQGIFTVTLIATKGVCQDTAVRYIKVDMVSSLDVPNVFTPNGDGKNDIFKFDAKNIATITLLIYDRWGLKMFESTETGNVEWDGKNKGGATVADGTYFYIITATGLDEVKYNLKGTVTVFQ